MNAKDAYIEHLENTIKDLQNQVNNLTDWRNHPEELEDLMPWSAAVQAECK